MSIVLDSMLHQSFNFDATSYEIYENGRCIQHAPCDTHISAEYSIFTGMIFSLIRNPTYIDDKFSLPTNSDDLLEDRVQYGRLRSIDYISGISSKPIVCNIFLQNGILRFATPNPLRLVEFSGMFKLIQSNSITMTPEKLFEQASALIQENDALRNSEEAWNIVHALQILIKANKLEPKITPLKIKIIIGMASCNYLMDNFLYAYNCAVIAKEKIDEYIEFAFDDSFTRKMLGEEECDKIIEAVKRNISIGASSRLMENHVLSYINTNNIRKAFPPKDDASFTKDELYHLIHSIEHTKNAIVSQAYSHGDYQVAKRTESIFNAYKYPLYYIWQKYKFGRDEDVWVEGENMLPYHMFVAKIKENTDELMSLLCNANPFAPLNNGSVITQLLKKILGDLQARLQGGRI